MKKILLLVFMLSGLNISAQEESYIEIAKAESYLSTLFCQLYDMDDLADKSELFAEIDSVFALALNLPGSYDYGWKKLDKIGKLKSEDGNLKVFSWLWMVNRDEYCYSAFIQYKAKKGEVKLVKLMPGTSSKIKSEDYSQKLDDWHGKVYYQIVEKELKKKHFYTLIGADFNNSRVTMKTLEVLVLQRGKLQFRGDQFLDGGTVKDRIIFQFSSELSSSVRYNKQLDMIVFDHLAPLHPLYFGEYQFYGPDGSYDGFRFKEGVWVKEEDVDAKNQ